jgi:hypothetical protein
MTYSNVGSNSNRMIFKEGFMALTERPQVRQPDSAPNTLNRGGESATQNGITPLDLLKTEKVFGIPKIIAGPIIGLLTILSAGAVAHEVYQIPSVHRTVDKVWDASLKTIHLRSNQA